MEFSQRLKNSWNAFKGNTADDFNLPQQSYLYGPSSGYRPHAHKTGYANERSIVNAVYNQISLDVASVDIVHIREDEKERYKEKMKSGLQNCLELSANIDQTSMAFMQDVVLSLFDEGVVAIVPVDTTLNPNNTGGYDVLTMRTGKVIEWYPRHVKINVYNDRKGTREDILMKKEAVAIVENPLYSVINEPNSTMQRLIRKLSLLDAVDEQSSSGKLDLIIQLPYVIKSDARREQAEMRRKDIEMQLKGSQYGIAYTDGTEKITQLNRPVENNLLNQIKYLTEMLYSQLGLDPTIFNGTANEATMKNYHNRTVKPILEAITLSMKRSFLTKTARTQGQSITYLRDPFELVPVSELADIADKFTRNEILTSNEIRSALGYAPVDDPGADELRNKNLNLDQSRTDPAIDATHTEELDIQEGEPS